jgi:hypothetical protein
MLKQRILVRFSVLGSQFSVPNTPWNPRTENREPGASPVAVGSLAAPLNVWLMS